MPNISAQALYTACAAGDAAAVSRLLPAGGTRLNLSAPPFKDPGTTSTPLMVAAFRGYTEVVRVLLERAPNTAVDAMNGNGGTALMATAWLHHADILRLLADHGANVNFMDQWRHTPLRQAVAPMLSDPSPRDPDPDGARQVATVRALLRLGAVPDPVDDMGMTPLCDACSLGLATVAVALLHHGAQIDFTTIPRRNQGIGCTPLMYAMVRNHPGVVKLLLKRGADGTKGTAKAAPGIDAGSTALDIARSRTNDTGDCAETLAVLRLRCCSTCGMTSPGLSAATVGEKQHLKRCGDCHVRGSRTRYCSKECQRADWVPRHRRECAEARRARHAAGTEV